MKHISQLLDNLEKICKIINILTLVISDEGGRNGCTSCMPKRINAYVIKRSIPALLDFFTSLRSLITEIQTAV